MEIEFKIINIHFKGRMFELKIFEDNNDLLDILKNNEIKCDRIIGLINRRYELINLETFCFNIVNHKENYELVLMHNSNNKNINLYNFFEKIKKIKSLKHFYDNKDNLVKILLIIDNIKYLEINHLILEDLDYFHCFYIWKIDLDKENLDDYNILNVSNSLIIFINNVKLTTVSFEFNEENIRNIFNKINKKLNNNSYSFENDSFVSNNLDKKIDFEYILCLLKNKLRHKFTIDQIFKIIYAISEDKKILDIINKNKEFENPKSIFNFLKRYIVLNEINYDRNNVNIKDILKYYKIFNIINEEEYVSIVNKIKLESIDIESIFKKFLNEDYGFTYHILNLLNKDSNIEGDSEEILSGVTETKNNITPRHKNRGYTFNNINNGGSSIINSNKDENFNSNNELSLEIKLNENSDEFWTYDKFEDILKFFNIINDFNKNEIILLNYYYKKNNWFYDYIINILINFNKDIKKNNLDKSLEAKLKSDLISNIRNKEHQILEKNWNQHNDNLIIELNNTVYNNIFIELCNKEDYDLFLNKINSKFIKDKNLKKVNSFTKNDIVNKRKVYYSINIENHGQVKYIKNNSSLSFNDSPSNISIKKNSKYNMVIYKFSHALTIKNFENLKNITIDNNSRIRKKTKTDYSNLNYIKDSNLSNAILNSQNNKNFDSKEIEIICFFYNDAIINEYKKITPDYLTDNYEYFNNSKYKDKLSDIWSKINSVNHKILCKIINIIIKLHFWKFEDNYIDQFIKKLINKQVGMSSTNHIFVFNCIADNFNLSIEIISEFDTNYYFSHNIKEFLKKEFNLNNLFLMSFYNLFITFNCILISWYWWIYVKFIYVLPVYKIINF